MAPQEGGAKLTTADACRRARMNRERLLRRVQSGDISGEQVAGRWLIDAASLEAYLKRAS